ncbi:MAG: AAA family ATPase, partial [Isosphaerales bacterium]
MYLREFRIHDIKCFEDVHLHFPHDGDDHSGWIVLLGGNGMGKSTLLQAMAIALMGSLGGQRLLLDPDGWVRKGRTCGEFSATIVRGRNDKSMNGSSKKNYNPKFAITGREQVTLGGILYDQPQLVQLADDRTRNDLMNGPYAARKLGWYCCGYGPFRRMFGGSEEAFRLMNPNNRESRFVTLFREDAALLYLKDDLPSLYRRSIDQNDPNHILAGELLEYVWKLIDGLLPGGVRISRVDTENVYFRVVGGAEVRSLDLSDGYRCFLALAFDIIYRWTGCYENPDSFLVQDGDSRRLSFEGVILIDEVDAHLHPFWQREIGFRLRKTFPRVQFIVTSHSPFVAQAASDGGLVVLRSTGPQGAVEAQL